MSEAPAMMKVLKFANHCLQKNVALSFLKFMKGLSSDKVKKFKQKFEDLDVENTGSLSREAVARIIEDEGTELEKLMVAILFEQYDKNNDKFIQLDEYLEFCAEMCSLTEKEILRRVFDFCDKDHNGRLDIDEVTQLGYLMGKEVTKSDAWATIRALDLNKDNTIDFDEFCAVIQ
jgi:Ca2+-binding EF-hand superfamily protein